jgi:hypothetical protein
VVQRHMARAQTCKGMVVHTHMVVHTELHRWLPMRTGSTEGRDPTQAMRLADTTVSRQMGLCSTGTTARRTTLTDHHPITKVREEGRLACTILHKATAPRPANRGRRAPVLRLTNTKPLHICMTTPSRTGMRRIEGAGPREAIPVHTVMGPLDLLALPDRTARPGVKVEIIEVAARIAKLRLESLEYRMQPLAPRRWFAHLRRWTAPWRWPVVARRGSVRSRRAVRAKMKIVSRPWILRAARLQLRFCPSPPAPAPTVLC